MDETGKFKQSRPVNGLSLIMHSTWGCLLFTIVMGVGTFFIGKIGGAYLKYRQDLIKAAYEKSHPGAAKPALIRTSAPQPTLSPNKN